MEKEHEQEGDGATEHQPKKEWKMFRRSKLLMVYHSIKTVSELVACWQSSRRPKDTHSLRVASKCFF